MGLHDIKAAADHLIEVFFSLNLLVFAIATFLTTAIARCKKVAAALDSKKVIGGICFV